MIENSANSQAAPRIAARERGPHDHFVQFYESEETLVSSVASFLGSGLGGGDTAVIIATQPHREAIDLRLMTHGLNVAALKARDQLICHDAADLVSKLLVDGKFEEIRFLQFARTLLNAVSQSGRPVRIYGEVSALLATQGNHDTAARVEELWNNLLETYPVTMFCAYPLDSFSGDHLTDSFVRICREHSHVIPAESYSARNSVDERLRCIGLLQQRATSLKAEIVARKNSEFALREEHTKLGMALTIAQIGTWDFCFETNRVTCSPRCNVLLNLHSNDHLTHESLLQSVHSEDRPSTLQKLDRAIADAGDFEGEFRIVGPSNQVRWVRMRCRYFQTGGPRIVGFVKDITAQKQFGSEEIDRSGAPCSQQK